MKINKKFVSMLVLISIIFLTGIGSCATWGVNNAENVNIGHEPVYLNTEDEDIYFTLTEYSGESLTLIEGYSGAKTSNLILHDEGNIRGGLVASNGYLYYVTEDGLFKRTLTSTTPLWANGEPVEAPQDNNVTVAGSTHQAPDEDMATVYTESSNVVKISSRSGIKGTLREEDGKIYYTTGSDFYSVNIENNLESYYTGWSNSVDTFDIYDGQIYGLHIDTNTYDTATKVYAEAFLTVYKDDTQIKYYSKSANSIEDYPSGTQEFRTGSINVINPNKVYVGGNLYAKHENSDSYAPNVNINVNDIINSTGGNVGTWSYDTTGTDVGRYIDHDSIISYKEPVFAQINYDGSNLVVAETQDAKSNPTTKPVELEYPEVRLSTEQDQYYNNTPISIQWGIEGQTVQIPEDEFRDNYRYQIDFINPDGFKFNEYRISASDLDITSVPLSNNIQFSGYGTVRLVPPSSNWNNGTYTVRMFEVNRTTSGKALLTQHSYEVVNESGTGAGTVEGEEKQEPESFSGLYGNDYFNGLMLVLIGGMALGFVGGLSGMLTGASAGIFVGFMLGFVPVWFVIMMVFALVVGVAAISRNVITGGGSNG